MSPSERLGDVPAWQRELRALGRSIIRRFPHAGTQGPERIRRHRKAAGGRQAVPFQKRALTAYKHAAYRHLGHHLDQHPDRHLEDRLKQADIKMSAGMFRSVFYLTSLLVFFGATLLALPIFLLAIGGAAVVPVALGVGGLTGLATMFVFRMSLGTRISSRKMALEKEIAFALSELGVLSSIGLSPVEIMRRMADRTHDPAMTREFRKVVYKTDIQGKDVISALAETAKGCPSEMLRETLWDIGNMIHQGSDLGEYLESQAGDMLEFKRSRQKEFIDQLTTYSDMYVTIVLIGIIFVGIAAFVMDAFGMGAGALDANGVLQLMTYGAIPFIILVISILLSTAHGQVE